MWKKYFKKARPNEDGVYSPLSSRGGRSTGENSVGINNYPNLLRESYLGCPNRIERYENWNQMDSDSEINSALDILAEFSTQNNEQDNMCFKVDFKDTPTETETKIIKKQLQSWYYLNEFNKRMFRLFRNVLKYGDQVFIRDPETFKLFYVEMDNVIKVIVNESKGKKPEQYIIRNINPNFENLTVTQVSANNLYNVIPSGAGTNASSATYNTPNSPYSSSSRFVHGKNENCVDAEHIVHFSLTEGLDPNWPFGNSILELVYKVYKQKELLEDSIIIYRVQRAPERRVFKIDVGDMPQHLAMAFIEKVKNEIHQRRIPGRSGDGNSNFMDSTYSGMGPNMDFFFPTTSCIKLDEKIKLLDGRSVSLQEIINEFNDGKKNWVYSINPDTQLIEPGEITWAGVTRKNTQVIKVTLDDGSSVQVTPDHRFIMRDGSEVEAQYLKNDDSIMPLYLSKVKTGKNQVEGRYLKFINPKNGNKEWVHTMVNPKSCKGKDRVIHHIDCNSLNNNPTNLIEMDREEHYELHRSLGSYHLIEAWSDPEKRKKLVDGIRKYHANATPEDKVMMVRRAMENPGFVDKQTNTEWKREIAKNFTADHKQSFKEGALKAAQKNAKEHIILFSKEMADRIIPNLMKGADTFNKMADALYSDEEFQTAYNITNPTIKRDANQSRIYRPTEHGINELVCFLGYFSWGEFINTRSEVMEKRKNVAKLNSIKGVIANREKRKVKLSEDMSNRLLELYLAGATTIKKLKHILATDIRFQEYYRIANPNIKRDKNKPFDYHPDWLKIVEMLKLKGYNSWNDFKTNYTYNHKVVSIEWMEELVDTGDITIKSKNNCHNFALDIGIFVHNSGRGSSVEQLPGGQNLNEINDLVYFNNKMMRGLRIPSSYLPTGQDDSPSTYNDGRMGTALIQEFRFNQYCERLQKLVSGPLDLEFKAYLKWSGINIDSSIFSLSLNPPQNFAHYRQAELDSGKISTFTQLEAYPYMSKRFLMKRYLGMTEEELADNQKLWREENQNPEEIEGEPSDLRNLGITAGGIDSDMGNFGGEEGMEDMGEGEEGEMPEGGETPGGANTPVAAEGPAPAEM